MKILLVNSSSIPGHVQIGDGGMHPYSLLFLTSYLKKNGYPSQILDLSTSRNSILVLNSYLNEMKPGLVGFTATTENRFQVWDMISLTRRVLPDSVIVVGGHHFTYTADAALEAIPEIDIIVRGEGEQTLLHLIQVLEKQGDLLEINGISYRSKNGTVNHNPERSCEPDIEKLMIDDDTYTDVILPCGSYSPYMLLRNYERERIKAIPIHVGRGCPHKCVYCGYSNMKYRTRKPEAVVDEIERKKKLFNCDFFHLQDPTLSKNTAFLSQFCSELKRRNLKIQWYAEVRADMNLDNLELMASNGCISLDFALESGSDTILETIKKRIKREQVEVLLEKSHKLGLRAFLFSMISLPDETERDAVMTRQFFESNGRKLASIPGQAVTRIYPGTELEKMAFERGVLSKNFSWYDRTYKNQMPEISAETPLWIEHLTSDFIRRCQNEMSDLNKRKLDSQSIKLSLAFKKIQFYKSKKDTAKLHLEILGLVEDSMCGEHLQEIVNYIVSRRFDNAMTELKTLNPLVFFYNDRITIIIALMFALATLRKNNIISIKELVRKISNFWHVFDDTLPELFDTLRSNGMITMLEYPLYFVDANDSIHIAYLSEKARLYSQSNRSDKAYLLRLKIEKYSADSPVLSNYISSALFNNAVQDIAENRIDRAILRLKRTLELVPEHKKAGLLLDQLDGKNG